MKYLIILLLTFSTLFAQVPIHKKQEHRTIAVLWSKLITNGSTDTRYMLQTHVEHLLNSQYGFKLVTREQKDLLSLFEESDLNQKGLTTNKKDVDKQLLNVDGVIRMEMNHVNGEDYLSMKMIAYPSGEIVSSSEPIIISGELKDVAQRALNTLLKTNTSTWRQDSNSDLIDVSKVLPKNKESKKMPIWAKVAGYVAIASLGYTMYELNETNKSYELYKGSVKKETASKNWSEYTKHRNRTLIASSFTLISSLTFTLGF